MTPCIAIPSGYICMVDGVVVSVNGRRYWFDVHGYFGLVPRTKDWEDDRKRMPPQSAWDAAEALVECIGGRWKVKEETTC